MKLETPIVWITAMPRSGTNWLSQIFAASPSTTVKFCPLFSYAFKNRLSEDDSAERWMAFFQEVAQTRDDYMDQAYLRRQGLVPSFERTGTGGKLVIKSTRFHHLTEPLIKKLQDIRFVAIVRNPCAAIHSWLTNPTEFPPGEDPLQQWRSGRCRKTAAEEYWGFDDWVTVTQLHLRLSRQYPDQFRLLDYDEFRSDPLTMTEAIFAWLGIEMCDQVAQFVRTSQSRHVEHPKSVFKGQRDFDRWKNNLQRPIRDAIERELRGTELEQFLGRRGD